MCRETVSVSWDGRLFDCDFNQQLAIPTALLDDSGSGAACSSGGGGGGESAGSGGGGGSSGGGARGPSVFDVSSLDELTGRPIAVGNHCFGCMAGSGSSCQGATA